MLFAEGNSSLGGIRRDCRFSSSSAAFFAMAHSYVNSFDFSGAEVKFDFE